jgi:hypothetical protein
MDRNVVKINKISTILIWESISNDERKVGYQTPDVKFTILQHTYPIHIDKTRLELVPTIERI